MDTLWIYNFEDGVVLTLVNIGFSIQELHKMTEIHGKVTAEHKMVRISY